MRARTLASLLPMLAIAWGSTAFECRAIGPARMEATPVRGALSVDLRSRIVRGGDRLWFELRKGTHGRASITLSDPSGQVVVREQVNDNDVHRLPLPRAAGAGNYTLKFEEEGRVIWRKLVIEQG